MISLTRQLNISIPIERQNGTRVFVHSEPISMEVFEQFHLVLARSWSVFAENGIVLSSAPSIAYMVLKKTAESMRRGVDLTWWDGVDGVQTALIGEIIRLSSLVAPGDGTGWTPIPLQVAIDTKKVDPEEMQEVLNLLAFFTVISRVPPRADRPTLMEGLCALYGAQSTQLNSTAYSTSLKTSTIGASSGEAQGS